MNSPRAINERITRVPVRVDQYFDDQHIGHASGFFYNASRGLCLVTNWHVVTGRNPSTLKLLSQKAAIPNKLRLHIPRKFGTNDMMNIRWQELPVDLYRPGDPAQPVWLEHPNQSGKRIDIAVIPATNLDGSALLTANDPQLDLDDLRLHPSMDVFIVGYPRGMFGGARLPIWKRGSIASEPEMDIDEKPVIYVDTATREGMSGAPVFAQEVGYWAPRGATSRSEYMLGTGRSFIGVYSGRIGAEDEFKAQLGLVWKVGALVEVLEKGVPGQSSFQMCAHP